MVVTVVEVLACIRADASQRAVRGVMEELAGMEVVADMQVRLC